MWKKDIADINNNATILRFIPKSKYFNLSEFLDNIGANINWKTPEPPNIIAVKNPRCTEFPPAFRSIEGIMVSTSIKLEANARNTACHKKLLKFIFDRFVDICIEIFLLFYIFFAIS